MIINSILSVILILTGIFVFFLNQALAESSPDMDVEIFLKSFKNLEKSSSTAPSSQTPNHQTSDLIEDTGIEREGMTKNLEDILEVSKQEVAKENNDDIDLNNIKGEKGSQAIDVEQRTQQKHQPSSLWGTILRITLIVLGVVVGVFIILVIILAIKAKIQEKKSP